MMMRCGRYFAGVDRGRVHALKVGCGGAVVAAAAAYCDTCGGGYCDDNQLNIEANQLNIQAFEQVNDKEHLNWESIGSRHIVMANGQVRYNAAQSFRCYY